MRIQKYKTFLIIENLITEVNWEEFPEVKKVCVDPEELIDYLNRVIANRGKSTNDREKFSRNIPFIHAKSKLLPEDPLIDVDIDEFKDKITEPPENILGANEKIQHSGSAVEFYYNMGLPAFRGILYDTTGEKFYYVNTCPGAGECIKICYALSGNYIRYSNAYDKSTRILNFLMNSPDEFKAKLKSEIKEKIDEHEAIQDNYNVVYIRFNDSGDFFSKKYYDIASEVIAELKTDFNVVGYAHTKIADIVKAKGEVKTSFSCDACKTEIDKIDNLDEYKNSITLPRAFYKGFSLKSKTDTIALLDKIAEEFKLERKYVITYKDLMMKKDDEKRRWYVLVVPGDGDSSVPRDDVKKIFHTEH